MADVSEWLANHLHPMTAPFLFAGAGLSRRYAAADDWQALLRHFAVETQQSYEYFYASADGDLPTVASRIAEQFHDIWWHEDRFAPARAQWASRATGRESALKIEVSTYLADMADRLPASGPLADEVSLLRAAVIDGVITTNFDPVLPSIFPDFKPFIGQEELLFANPQGVGELYQIHGSCSRPSSLVLTASDYKQFEDRNPYLAAKLTTIFVEHPVMFIGYSLTDKNIISILKSIASCLTQQNIDQLRDRLIFVQWDPEAPPTVGPYTLMVGDFVTTVQRVVVPDFIDVFEVLGGIRRVFPARLLRVLKEHVYDLVLTKDPKERLHVADIEDDVNAADLEVVFGVGVSEAMSKRGYVGLTRHDLIQDVAAGGTSLDATAIVEDVLPVVLSGSVNVPVFKYLRQAGLLDEHGEVIQGAQISQKIDRMAAKVRAGLPASSGHRKKAPIYLHDITSIAQLEAAGGFDAVVNFGTCMDPEFVDLEDLAQLIAAPDRFVTDWQQVQYTKLVCFYDWLRYGRSGADTAASGQAASVPAPRPSVQPSVDPDADGPAETPRVEA